jgi:hypothetical protein
MHYQIDHDQNHFIKNPLARQIRSSQQSTHENKRLISTHQKSLSYFFKEARES